MKRSYWLSCENPGIVAININKTSIVNGVYSSGAFHVFITATNNRDNKIGMCHHTFIIIILILHQPTAGDRPPPCATHHGPLIIPFI